MTFICSSFVKNVLKIVKWIIYVVTFFDCHTAETIEGTSPTLTNYLCNLKN
jgi:hypothetical protein